MAKDIIKEARNFFQTEIKTFDPTYINPNKRLHIGDKFTLQGKRCKVTYIAETGYYYVHIDTPRDGFMNFWFFEKKFSLGPDGYYGGWTEDSITEMQIAKRKRGPYNTKKRTKTGQNYAHK